MSVTPRRSAPSLLESLLAMRIQEPPVQFRKLPAPAYRVRSRELPQRLLGAILWIALFIILWKFGAR